MPKIFSLKGMLLSVLAKECCGEHKATTAKEMSVYYAMGYGWSSDDYWDQVNGSQYGKKLLNKFSSSARRALDELVSENKDIRRIKVNGIKYYYFKNSK